MPRLCSLRLLCKKSTQRNDNCPQCHDCRCQLHELCAQCTRQPRHKNRACSDTVRNGTLLALEWKSMTKICNFHPYVSRSRIWSHTIRCLDCRCVHAKDHFRTQNLLQQRRRFPSAEQENAFQMLAFPCFPRDIKETPLYTYAGLLGSMSIQGIVIISYFLAAAVISNGT